MLGRVQNEAPGVKVRQFIHEESSIYSGLIQCLLPRGNSREYIDRYLLRQILRSVGSLSNSPRSLKLQLSRKQKRVVCCRLALGRRILAWTLISETPWLMVNRHACVFGMRSSTNHWKRINGIRICHFRLILRIENYSKAKNIYG